MYCDTCRERDTADTTDTTETDCGAILLDCNGNGPIRLVSEGYDEPPTFVAGSWEVEEVPAAAAVVQLPPLTKEVSLRELHTMLQILQENADTSDREEMSPSLIDSLLEAAIQGILQGERAENQPLVDFIRSRKNPYMGTLSRMRKLLQLIKEFGHPDKYDTVRHYLLIHLVSSLCRQE